MDDHQLIFARRFKQGQGHLCLNDEWKTRLSPAQRGIVSLGDVAAASPLRLPPPVTAETRTDLPSISVVIPTHKRPALLKRAVQSVIDQDYAGRIEAIVVFDRSEPTEVGPADLPPNREIVTLVNGRTPGMAGGRNTGILAARGDVVAFLDDDDEWLPLKTTRQVDLLRRGEADAVLSGVRFLAGDRYRDQPITIPDEDPAIAAIRTGMYLPIQTLVVWNSVLGSDLLDEAFPGGGDQEFVIRLMMKARVTSLAEPLVLVNRQHTSRLTMDYEWALANFKYMRAKHRGLIEAAKPDISLAHARFALLAFGNRRRRDARMWATRAVRANPRRLKNWLIALAVVILPPITLDRIQFVHHRLFWRRLS